MPGWLRESSSDPEEESRGRRARGQSAHVHSVGAGGGSASISVDRPAPAVALSVPQESIVHALMKGTKLGNSIGNLVKRVSASLGGAIAAVLVSGGPPDARVELNVQLDIRPNAEAVESACRAAYFLPAAESLVLDTMMMESGPAASVTDFGYVGTRPPNTGASPFLSDGVWGQYTPAAVAAAARAGTSVQGLGRADLPADTTTRILMNGPVAQVLVDKLWDRLRLQSLTSGEGQQPIQLNELEVARGLCTMELSTLETIAGRSKRSQNVGNGHGVQSLLSSKTLVACALPYQCSWTDTRTAFSQQIDAVEAAGGLGACEADADPEPTSPLAPAAVQGLSLLQGVASLLREAVHELNDDAAARQACGLVTMPTDAVLLLLNCVGIRTRDRGQSELTPAAAPSDVVGLRLVRYLQYSVDWFQLFIRGSFSVGLGQLVQLNRSPATRTMTKHITPILVTSGPREPKDLNRIHQHVENQIAATRECNRGWFLGCISPAQEDLSVLPPETSVWKLCTTAAAPLPPGQLHKDMYVAIAKAELFLESTVADTPVVCSLLNLGGTAAYLGCTMCPHLGIFVTSSMKVFNFVNYLKLLTPDQLSRLRLSPRACDALKNWVASCRAELHPNAPWKQAFVDPIHVLANTASVFTLLALPVRRLAAAWRARVDKCTKNESAAFPCNFSILSITESLHIVLLRIKPSLRRELVGRAKQSVFSDQLADSLQSSAMTDQERPPVDPDA